MTHLPPDICLRLRDAGLPQPEPKPGQVWYNGFIPVYVGMKSGMSHDHDPAYFCLYGGNKLIRGVEDINKMLFCPDAEYLLAHLPPGYVIQKHNGHHQFGDQYTVFHLAHPLIVDAAPTAVRAAADVYLAMHEKTLMKVSRELLRGSQLP